MREILLILLAFIVGIVALIFSSKYYMQFCLKVMVQKKHEWLDFIMITSCAPEEWVRPYIKTISRMKNRKISQERIKRVRDKAQISCVNRLNKLIKYVQVATLIKDDDVRNQIKKSLLLSSEKWQKGEGVFCEYPNEF